MDRPPPTPAERRELDRVGAFSDGVFAIAITLLVLNLDVPDVPGRDLGAAIGDLSDDFVAYAIGFAVIGLFWFEHHKLFARLGRTTGRLVLINTALLASIALMPFTTAVIGRYDEALAVTLYAGNVAATIVLNGLLGLVALQAGLAAEPDPGAARRGEIVAGTASRALVFLASIPIAYLVSQSLAKWFWLLLLALSLVDDRRARRRHRRA